MFLADTITGKVDARWNGRLRTIILAGLSRTTFAEAGDGSIPWDMKLGNGGRMGAGYYEHEVEARYTEGMLAKSQDWQWFVNETWKAFQAPEWKGGTFDGFRRAFYGVSRAYGHLSAVADTWTDLRLSFSCEWVRRVWESCLIRAGARKLPDDPTGDVFFDLLDVVSYSTRLLNSVSDRKLTYDLGLFSLGNYQDLFELGDLTDEGERVVSRLREIDTGGLTSTIAVVEGNFDGRRVKCDEELIGKVLDKEFDADFLDFKAPDEVVCKTWQEAYLLDCLRTSYQGDELMPLVGFREGGSIPDFSLITEVVLANMRRSIADPRAQCMIDSMAYLLHEVAIPQASAETLVNLALGRIGEVADGSRKPYEITCTATGLCSRMLERNQLEDGVKPRLLGGISRATKGVEDVAVLAAIDRMGFPLDKGQKKALKNAKRAKSTLVSTISDPNALLRYLEDEDVKRYCGQQEAEAAMDRFAELAGKAGSITAPLFIAAMNFFIGLLNNKDIDIRWAKSCLIDIQANWSETFYARTVAGMRTITQEISVPGAQSEELSKAVLENPLLFGRWAFPLDESSIEERIEGIVKYPVAAMAQKTTIDEFIPHKERFDPGSDSGKHSMDAMILGEIGRINRKYSYRHVNQLKADEIAAQLCAEAVRGAYVLSSMIRVIPEMYDAVRRRVSSRYALIDYPAEGEEPTLAHVCQLFPVMENTIRELGKHFSITPFRASEDKFHMLRDAPQIIGELIGSVLEETGTIAGTDDLTFVYFAMFSKNGLNIRNACVHGQGYQRDGQLDAAFRLTVICEYMLLYRLNKVIQAEEEPGSQAANVSAPQGSTDD